MKLTPRSRTHGKISLSSTDSENRQVKHELAFSEIVDTTEKRYKLHIGYVGSNESTVYYAFDARPVIMVRKRNCSLYDHPSSLVPELSWFTDLMLPGVEVKKLLFKTPYLVGPIGIIFVLASLTGASNVSIDAIASSTCVTTFGECY